MDNRQEHLKNLSEIRSLMERSSSFISLSGLSGVSAGIIGLITAFALYAKIYFNLDYTDYEAGAETRSQLIFYGVVISAFAIIATFALAFFFTARKAKKRGIPVWDGSAKRMASSLFIPLITGGIFCIILVYHEYDWLVLPSMLIFYGLALINAGKYTLHEIVWLGLTEVVLGLLAAFFIPQAIFLWGLGFGVMNIIYGLVMYFRHER